MPTILSDLALRLYSQVSEFKKGLTEASTQVKRFNDDSKKATTAVSKNFSSLSKQTGGAIQEMTGGLGAFGPAASQAMGGFQALSAGAKMLNASLGPIGLIIAAVVVVVKALASYFKGSTDGAEKFATIMGYLQGVLKVINDAFIALGRIIVKAFEDPKKAVADLWEAIKTNIWNRWEGLIAYWSASFEFLKNGFNALKETIKGVFSKDAKDEAKKYWEQAKQNLIDMGDSAIQVATGLDKAQRTAIGEKIAAGLKKVNAVAKANAQIEKEAYQLKLAKIALDERSARLNNEISEIVLKATDKETYSAEQRLAFNNQAKALIEEQGAIALAYAKKELELQDRRMALGENNIEALEKRSQLVMTIEGLEKGVSDRLKEVIGRNNEINAQIKTEAAAKKAAADEEAKEMMDSKDLRTKNTREIQKDINTLKADLKEISQSEALKLNFELDTQLINEGVLRVGEEMKAFNELRLLEEKKLQAEITAIDKEAEEVRKEQKLKIAEDTATSLTLLTDAVSSLFEASKNRELKAAGDNAAAKEAIEKKYAKKQQKISIVQALVNTALAVTKALSGSPPPLNFILAAATAAAGLAQVASIASQSFAMGGIVQGTSTYGDRTLVRANAGEMFLNKGQQRKLFDLINGGVGGGGKVVFEIQYDKLVGVLNTGSQIAGAY